jgi:NAD(P)-dependent dehydrogenase (short-subunit alcohol dehydrogenase family)
MRLLEGKVVVVGGVGESMGRSTSIRAAAHGAKVVMFARTASRLEAIQKEITDAGGEAIAVPGDMEIVADCRRAAQTAIDRYGRIDGVSMIGCTEPDRMMFDDTDDDFVAWRKITDANLYGTLQFVKACVKHMGPGGSVAIVGSLAQDQPAFLTAPYSAAKAGLAAAVRVLAVEYGAQHKARGLRFNLVSAGGVAGPPYFRYVGELAELAGITREEQQKLMIGDHPKGYVTLPDEYADSLIFLMSDMSAGINGQNIHVNGGEFMKP